MLAANRERILARLEENDIVLDVGAWADPFERADWVIDLLPYETRGHYERMEWQPAREKAAERFTKETWIQRDVCDREPLPFADDAIDFVVCAQTLEDLRDPIWVCSEMARVGKAGYVEVPSRLEEQSVGLRGEFAGWAHHRWLIAVEGPRIEFVHKDHGIHTREGEFLPRELWEQLEEEQRVETLWWEGDFGYSERIFSEMGELQDHLREFVAAALAEHPVPSGAGTLGRLKRRLAER